MREVYFDTDNIGDQMSRPSLYFDLDWFPGTVFGGGVLRRSNGVEPAPWIAWGVGSTRRHERTPKARPAGFALFGSRDYGQEDADAWVPCASCMHPLFDETWPEPEHEAVWFYNRQKPTEGIGDLPAAHNEQPFRAILTHLASGRVVVTNSYHGIYWATLLGRAAVAYRPYSSKFWCFKHPPAMCVDGPWQAAAGRARAYPYALEECREANRKFYEMVKERFA